MRNFFVKYVKFFTVILLMAIYVGCILLIGKFSSAGTPQTSIVQDYAKEESNVYNNFVVIGDSGNDSKAQWDVGKAITDICVRINCQAGFIAGDVIYDAGVSSVDDPQFRTKFEEPYQDINIPFYIAYGNHDFLGCTECYLQYNRKSEKWRMPGRYYTVDFSFGGKFIVINTENFDKAQQVWLQQQLTDTDGWKVVIGHRPLVTYEEAHPNEDFPGKAELKDILCNQADIYISGHSHLLEDAGQVEGCHVRQIISGGGGASPRKILPDNKSLFYYEGNGLITFQAEEKRIIIKFLNEKGKILYSADIT